MKRNQAGHVADSFVLTIEDGPQRGASLVPAHGPNRIGSGLDSDIVLADPLLAAAHVLLDIGEAPILRALGDDVRVQQGPHLRAGAAYPIRHSFSFVAGGTTFRLDCTAPVPASPRASWSGRLAAPATLALSAFMLLLFAPTGETIGVVPIPAPIPAHVAAATLPAVQVPAVQADHGGLLEAVVHRLSAAGLVLRAVDEADGSVSVSGALTPEQKDAWTATRRWFDAAYGSRAVLVDRTSAADFVAPLTVAAIRPGPMPFVIDRNGQKLFPGSTLPGGWVIDSIDAQKVTVRHNGQLLAVRF